MTELSGDSGRIAEVGYQLTNRQKMAGIAPGLSRFYRIFTVDRKNQPFLCVARRVVSQQYSGQDSFDLKSAIRTITEFGNMAKSKTSSRLPTFLINLIGN